MPINVVFSNTNLTLQSLRGKYLTRLRNMSEPVFETYEEDIGVLRNKLVDFQSYETILLIANGGSVWSFMSYYTALADRIKGKTVVPLTDMEPDFLDIIKKKYSTDSTLVIVISKSGSTVGAIENLFALSEYRQLYVTDTVSPLGQIGKKRGVPIIEHPPVGGRFSSFSSCAYVPAILTGLPVEEIEKGARAAYRIYGDPTAEANTAVTTAMTLYDLEANGYSEVFLPIYSNFLQTFGMQVTQLFHESFGKDGLGLTVVAAQAPESQHHTNQRFFGGRKNMVGCFLRVKEQHKPLAISIPRELYNIPIRSGQLADLDNMDLADSFASEYEGTVTDAKNQEIPVIEISVSEVSGQTVGELMAFWHYVTVYSAVLRGVNPYDQPQVESSKVISFDRRLKR